MLDIKRDGLVCVPASRWEKQVYCTSPQPSPEERGQLFVLCEALLKKLFFITSETLKALARTKSGVARGTARGSIFRP